MRCCFCFSHTLPKQKIGVWTSQFNTNSCHTFLTCSEPKLVFFNVGIKTKVRTVKSLRKGHLQTKPSLNYNLHMWSHDWTFFDATTLSVPLRNVHKVEKCAQKKSDLNKPVYCSRTKISRAFTSGGRGGDKNNNNIINMKKRKRQRCS